MKKRKKKLGLLGVFCTATGAMIGSGLFILPGLAHSVAGPAVIASYFLAGLLALAGLFSQAELVSAMPKTGGSYFYVTRSMGPAIGTVNGLITWFSLSLKSSFALVGMAAFTMAITSLDIRLVAAGLCLIFVIANIVGIREAGRLEIVMVVALLGILVYYIIYGARAVNVDNLTPFAPAGTSAVFTAAGMVFISYGGLLKVGAIAEEVEHPEKTIPIGMILSLFCVSILYTLVVFITSGILGDALNSSLTPISDAGRICLGTTGKRLLDVAAILAFVSTANAGIMAASRYPTALARDELIPPIFSRSHRRFGTPYVSILATGILVLAAVFLELRMLVKLASSVLILTFLFSCISVLIMRESRLQNYRPQFKSPGYPWTQCVGIIGFGVLLYTMGREAMAATCGLAAIGLFVYWLYGRIRSTREYALLHLVERITARELTANLLETELKEIIRERDDIEADRFDRIIEDCAVIDTEETLDMEAFFSLAAEQLAARVGLTPERAKTLLAERERESSTVIAPGLSIPHIILPGEHTFELLLARSKNGIRFASDAEPVHAVFVLAGTRDERNFHLRALSAIAQIVQDPDFLDRWLSARGPEALRDIVLLGKRLRQSNVS